MPLTRRQLQVIKLVALGFITKEIADNLGISLKTAEKHRMWAMQRLGIKDVATLTHYALAHGLVENIYNQKVNYDRTRN